MPITETQREQRRKHLGSSDMAAVMGLDSWGNAYDVYLEKTGKLDPEKDKAIFRRGNYMEAALLAYAQDQLGELVVSAGDLEYIKPLVHLCSHPDAMAIEVADRPQPIEAKSLGWYAPDFWGDPGTDQCPDRTLIQTHVHMICTDTQFCHVPVYLPKREFQMYVVAYDQAVAETICEAAVAFWNDHVVKDIPPENVTPAMAVLKRIRRNPDITNIIPDGLATHLSDAKAAAKSANNMVELIKTDILTAMGTAEGGICEGGLFTYFEQNRKGYTVADGKCRVLRFKKGKSNGN